MEDEDLIREHMEETRTAMTEKLETLEQKVVGTVQEATSAVTDTVASVKDSIEDTVTSVTDSVQETVTAVKDSMEGGVEAVKSLFDVPALVKRHPWPMVGGSMTLGFVLGKLLGARGRAPATAAADSSERKAERYFASESQPAISTPAAKSPGFFEAFGPEIAKLKGLALGTLMGVAREMIVKAVPPHLGDKLENILNGVTEKLGGEPLPHGEGLFDKNVTAPEPGNGRERERDPVGSGFRR